VSDHLNPNRFTDSAGKPWEGRAFEANAFAEDDGTAPEQFLAALASFRSGNLGAEKVVDSIRTSRLLIPLLAQLGESVEGAHGQRVDKSADLSIVTVKSPDNQDSLVVFSSVAAMARWNSTARPVPSDAIRVALAAASQLNTRVVLDPGSDTEFVLRRPVIAKIAQSLPWLPPERNPAVIEAVAASVAAENLVLDFALASGDPASRLLGAELQVTLVLKPGADAETVRELVERVTARWSQSEDFARDVDSVAVKLRSS